MNRNDEELPPLTIDLDKAPETEDEKLDKIADELITKYRSNRGLQKAVEYYTSDSKGGRNGLDTTLNEGVDLLDQKLDDAGLNATLRERDILSVKILERTGMLGWRRRITKALRGR
jgi:hypothetical protein